MVGYLFPLRLSFTVEVFLTLVIGGTGAYVLGRVLRLGGGLHLPGFRLRAQRPDARMVGLAGIGGVLLVRLVVRRALLWFEVATVSGTSHSSPWFSPP